MSADSESGFNGEGLNTSIDGIPRVSLEYVEERKEVEEVEREEEKKREELRGARGDMRL